MTAKDQLKERFRAAAVFKQLGPGLVTGAADDDPSGIATYSQAGAQFGFNMLWTMALTYPLSPRRRHVWQRPRCNRGRAHETIEICLGRCRTDFRRLRFRWFHYLVRHREYGVFACVGLGGLMIISMSAGLDASGTWTARTSTRSARKVCCQTLNFGTFGRAPGQNNHAPRFGQGLLDR